MVSLFLNFEFHILKRLKEQDGPQALPFLTTEKRAASEKNRNKEDFSVN